MNDVRSWRVLSPVEGKDRKTRWVKLGRAYRNKDGSTNVYLDALPTNSTLQLREWDDDEARPDRRAPTKQMSLEAAADIPF